MWRHKEWEENNFNEKFPNEIKFFILVTTILSDSLGTFTFIYISPQILAFPPLFIWNLGTASIPSYIYVLMNDI